MILLALLCVPSTLVFAQDEEKPAEKKADANTYVGRGYDITENFADVRSLRASIFELRADDVKMEPINLTTKDEISGKSLSEYQSKFSNKLSIGGSYAIFSGSVSVNFDKNDASSSAKEYVTLQRRVVVRSYEMPHKANDKITAAARGAIDSDDPNKLFEEYGTHYVMLAEVGGRVDYNMTFNRSSTQKDINLQVAAKAELKAVIGSVNIENETAYGNSLKKVEEAGKLKIAVYGGSAESRSKIEAGQAGLEEWSKSVEENPVLCNFTNRSLKPIWELASTPERAHVLEQAFITHANSKAIRETPGGLMVQHVTGSKQVASNWYGKGTDGAGNANHRFAAWTPVPDTTNGYYVVGHAANRDSETKKTGRIKTIMVKEIGEPGKLLASPIGFEKVTETSGGERKWSIWRANCPANFVALGDFAKWEHDEPNMDIPSQNPFKDVRCVNRGQVEAAAPLSKNEIIHDNDGSGEWKFVTYKIEPASGSNAINGNFFYGIRPNEFSDEPPADAEVWVLKNPAGAGMAFLVGNGGEDSIAKDFGDAFSPMAGFDPDAVPLRIATARFRMRDVPEGSR